jgi:hypothetical protein
LRQSGFFQYKNNITAVFVCKSEQKQVPRRQKNTFKKFLSQYQANFSQTIDNIGHIYLIISKLKYRILSLQQNFDRI